MLLAALLLVIVGVVLFITYNVTVGLVCLIVGAVVALALVLTHRGLP